MPLARDEVTKAVAELRKNTVGRKFKQSVELIVRLREVDLKKPENRISESVELPNPPDRPTKICVIASGDLATRARSGGADLVLGRDDLDRLGRDKKAARKLASEYDYFVAEAPMMPQVGKALGTVLGPRGKMPTPIPPNAPIENAVNAHRRMTRLRVRDQPVLQCRIGTESMPDEKLVENIQTVFSRIEGKLERGMKNVSEILLKATMGRPVKIPLGKA